MRAGRRARWAPALGDARDFLFPEHRLVVELDCYEYHDGREQFERDRDRDVDLLASEIATARVTWERLNDSPARGAAPAHDPRPTGPARVTRPPPPPPP